MLNLSQIKQMPSDTAFICPSWKENLLPPTWTVWFSSHSCTAYVFPVLQVSNGMLITDNNPATFWVSHPNNTLIGNVAAGSLEGFGFWYHLEDYPTGPSKTYSICPKYERMGVFR